METLSYKNLPLRIAAAMDLPKLDPYAKVFKTNSIVRHAIYGGSPILDSKGKIIAPGNGLIEAGALIRIGRRIYFDLDRLDVWLLAHRVTA